VNEVSAHTLNDDGRGLAGVKSLAQLLFARSGALTTGIGHAQAFWGNIDKLHDQNVNYPKGKITPGGITDRYLSDYPNMYADMSAGSGLLALTRDEEHTTGFFGRHQDKILYGSDCADHLGRGPGCQGAQTIAMIRKLSPTKAVERKILWENSKRLFRL
jgi:hypothetical protein